jgi:hypothetical protein
MVAAYLNSTAPDRQNHLIADWADSRTLDTHVKKSGSKITSQRNKTMSNRAKVKIRNPKTLATAVIPAAELAPGMMAIERPGHGVAFESLAEMAPLLGESPFQHPPFDAALRDRMAKLKAALDEIVPKTLEKWEEGFRKDTNMEREIQIWECIAEGYSKAVDLFKFTGPQRRECLAIILAVVNNGQHALETVQLDKLSKKQAEEVVMLFTSKQRPW